MWEHYLNRAIRQGKWKLVALKRQPWELYDIAADRNETNDLAAEHQDVVERLEKAFIETRLVEPDFPSPTYDAVTR